MVTAISLVPFSACGTEQPESAADGVASLDDSTGEPTDDTTGEPSEATATTVREEALEAPEDIEEAMTLFQACMEEHGVEGGGMMVATSFGEGGTIEVRNDEIDEPGPQMRMEEIDPEVFEAADEACRGHLDNAMPEFDLTPEQEAAMEDASLEFTACMEAAGVEMPEMSTPGGDTLTLNVSGGEATSSAGVAIDDIDFEEFNRAAEGCQSVYDEYPELDDVMGGGGRFVVSNEVKAP
jgi:hypothetical protein